MFENELLDMMTMGLYNIGFQISDREEYIKTELLKKDRQASVIGGQFLGLAGSLKIGAGLSQPKIGVPGGAKVPKKLPKLPRLNRVKETPKVPKTPVASGGRTRYKLEKISPGREGKRFKVVEGRSRGLGSGEFIDNTGDPITKGEMRVVNDLVRQYVVTPVCRTWIYPVETVNTKQRHRNHHIQRRGH